MARPPVFVLPHQPCYHPLHLDVPCLDLQGRHGGVGGPQFHDVAASIVTFERRLSSDHRHDRLPILQRRLLLDDDQITLSDAIVDHRVPPHLHHKMGSRAQEHRRDQNRLVCFEDLDRLTGHDPADQRQF